MSQTINFGKKQIFVFVDLETAGLNLYANGIIQIGAVATGDMENEFFGYFVSDADPVKGGLPHEAFQRVERSALEINKFTDDRIESAPYLSAVLERFHMWLESLATTGPDGLPREIIIVCHNAKFDVPRLEFAYAEYGLRELKSLRRVLCTISLGFEAFEEMLPLEKLAAMFNIVNHQSHDALSDAYTTMRVFHAIRSYKRNVVH